MEIFGNRIGICLFIYLEYQDIKGLEKSSLSHGDIKSDTNFHCPSQFWAITWTLSREDLNILKLPVLPRYY